MRKNSRQNGKRKHPGAVALARLRAKSLTADRRSEIAREAAMARWEHWRRRKVCPDVLDE